MNTEDSKQLNDSAADFFDKSDSMKHIFELALKNAYNMGYERALRDDLLEKAS